MVDEYSNNNPQDELEEIFSKPEAQIPDISLNMAILLETLEMQEKGRPSSSSITSSQYLFKVEAEVEIKPYQGDIVIVKLN
jgi:hypothetical protein